MEKILGFGVDIVDVKVNLKKKFEAVFDVELEEILDEKIKNIMSNLPCQKIWANI